MAKDEDKIPEEFFKVEKKVSFGKIVFSGNRGPYIVAFEDTTTRDYCEMNAIDFKSVSINDIKSDAVPIWQCGAKSSDEINALPKLNLKQQKEKVQKEKEKRKAEKVAKLKATIKENKKKAKRK